MNAPRESKAAPRISRRGESLGTENAFVVLAEVNALARQGRDIVSFCIGQPDFPTPANIQDAAVAAIRAGKHGYTPSAGIDELRAAAARDLGAGHRDLGTRVEQVGEGHVEIRDGAGRFQVALECSDRQARLADDSLLTEWQVYRLFEARRGAWATFQYLVRERLADEGVTVGPDGQLWSTNSDYSIRSFDFDRTPVAASTPRVHAPFGIAAGSNTFSLAPSFTSVLIIAIAGDSRTSSVSALKARPKTPRRFPRKVHRALRTFPPTIRLTRARIGMPG